MERIFYTKYWTDTMEEAKACLAENQPKLQTAISDPPLFSALSNETFEDFQELALLCHELAAHEDAELELSIDADQNTAEILLTAPCFVFGSRQLILLQKISFWTSEVIFDVTEETQSQITVTFDFSKANETLRRQLEGMIASLKR